MRLKGFYINIKSNLKLELVEKELKNKLQARNEQRAPILYRLHRYKTFRGVGWRSWEAHARAAHPANNPTNARDFSMLNTTGWKAWS